MKSKAISQEKLIQVIRALERSAKQNEEDSQAPGSWGDPDSIQAGAVAREQRRMLVILWELVGKKK